MNQCKCGSHAINPHCHGRESGVDLNLCDVCYWRTRAEAAKAASVCPVGITDISLIDIIESLRCLLRYDVISVEYNRSGRGEQSPEGNWVKWEDVSEIIESSR